MFKQTTGQTASFNDAPTITNGIFAMFELGFALLSPTIVAASLSGIVFIVTK
jgi:hypothetical protein